MREHELLELWNLCACDGNEQEWERLIDAIERDLRSILSRRLHAAGASVRAEDFEERLQEVYCRLLEADRRVMRRLQARSGAQLYGYLKRICASVAIDHVRGTGAKKRRRTSGRGVPIAHEGVTPASAERELQLREGARLLTVLCAQLWRKPDTFRRNHWILSRLLLQGWTSREVAARVGLAPSGVESLLHRFCRQAGRRRQLVL